MKKVKSVIICCIFVAFSSFADIHYSKEQLNNMASSGDYPEQEDAVTKSANPMSFEDCKSGALSMYSQVVGDYPVEIVVDTNILYVLKLWTNDGAIVMSCSGPDQKRVITVAKYK